MSPSTAYQATTLRSRPDSFEEYMAAQGVGHEGGSAFNDGAALAAHDERSGTVIREDRLQGGLSRWWPRQL